MRTERVYCGDLRKGDRIYIQGYQFDIVSDPIRTDADAVNQYGAYLVRFEARAVEPDQLPRVYAEGIYGARDLVKYVRIIPD